MQIDHHGVLRTKSGVKRVARIVGYFVLFVQTFYLYHKYVVNGNLASYYYSFIMGAAAFSLIVATEIMRTPPEHAQVIEELLVQHYRMSIEDAARLVRSLRPTSFLEFAVDVGRSKSRNEQNKASTI